MIQCTYATIIEQFIAYRKIDVVSTVSSVNYESSYHYPQIRVDIQMHFLHNLLE